MKRFKKLEVINIVKHNDEEVDAFFKPIGVKSDRNLVINMYIQKDGVNIYMEDENKAYDELMFLTDEEELSVLKCYAIATMDIIY